MSPVSRSLCTTVALALVLAAAPAPARAAAPLVTLRVKSLNAALSDVEIVSKSVGQPKTRKEMLAQIAATLGVPDLAFLDLDRPLAVAFPFEGMALGAKGLVVSVPVKDAGAALAAIGKSFPTHTKEGGIDMFRGAPKAQPDGTTATDTYAVAVRRQVLVISSSPDLVKSFDEAAALSGTGLPKGSLALAVQIEPIAPLLKMGLIAGKQKLTETPPAAEGDGSGQAGGDGTAENAKPAPDGQPAPDVEPAPRTPAPKFDMEAMRPLLDFYLNVVSDALDNMSAFQLALEVKDKQLVIHERVLPKAQSTLADFVAAQKDAGLPHTGGLLPRDAAVVAAGRMTATASSRAYLAAAAESYAAVMKALLGKQFAGNTEALDEMMASMQDVRTFTACQRGDLAMAMDFTPGGMRLLEFIGVTDDASCANVLESMQMGKVGERKYTKVERSVLDPEGIPTYLSTTHIPKELDVTGAVATIYGKDGIVVRSARINDLLVIGTDAWSSKAIREVAAGHAAAAGRGLAPADLGPFTEGSGIFGRIDLGALLAAFQSMPAGQDGKPPVKPELAQALKGAAGRITFALHFLDSSGNLDFALPLALFEAFQKYGPEMKPRETAPPKKDAPAQSTRRGAAGAPAPAPVPASAG